MNALPELNLSGEHRDRVRWVDADPGIEAGVVDRGLGWSWFVGCTRLERALGSNFPDRVLGIADTKANCTSHTVIDAAAANVGIEHFKQGPEITDVAANITVEKPGQKQIVIGKGGEKLKAIGTDARADIERLLDGPVMLRLWVKVKGGWSNDDKALRQFGYGPN